MTVEEIKDALQKALPQAGLRCVRESILVENPADLPRVAQFLKEDGNFRMDYLSSVTGSDFLEYLESVYHLYSMEKKSGEVTLRVRVPRDKPVIPSLVSIYRGAEFQEREAYDMYGIEYENHPDLRRIFMWEGFEGYPMRKDYQQEDSETLEMEDVEWLDKHDIEVPEEARKKAEALKKEGKRATAWPSEGGQPS